MVDARAIDVSNRIAQCRVKYCQCFKPNCCCSPFATRNLPESLTPEPVACMCNQCAQDCDANYATKKQTGSQPVKMVMEAAKRNTNYLLVPVNISKEQASRLHDMNDKQRYAALNELGDEPNNCFWRDTVNSKATSTTEHLTAFASMAKKENDAYLRNMLDKHLK